MTDWDELSPLEIDNQRLRADCAKLETAHGQNIREIDRLRAELAAERERAQLAIDEAEARRDERDKLREALERARPYINHQNGNTAWDLLAAIDAVLKETKG